MRTHDQLMERMKDYKGAESIYTSEGYIAWQCSTGENYEILFIEVREQRQGAGTALMKKFIESVKPYHSVFVFRRENNEAAGQFYRKLGFVEQVIPGLYKGENAVLGIVPFNVLKEKCTNP